MNPKIRHTRNTKPVPPKPRIVLHARQVPVQDDAQREAAIERMQSEGWTYKATREGIAYFYLIKA